MKNSRLVKAIIVLGLYFFASNFVFISSLRQESYLLYLPPMAFGMVMSVLFLYFFEHENFFKFAREVESLEKKKEEKFLKRVAHMGRVLATVIVGTIGGPIFSALTAHTLLRKYKSKYLLVVLISIPSTVLWMGTARGIFNFFF